MSKEDLRLKCIKNGWFTCGTCEQYEKLFKLNDMGAANSVLALTIWLCSDDEEYANILKVLNGEA